MDRRAFIGTLAGTVFAAPLTAQAQRSAIPVVGFLCSASPVPYTPFVVAFRQGLREAGYVEGKNLTIEFRWADGHYDRLPMLASDLVRRRVAVLVAVGSDGPVLAAKTATATIPIVFASGGDPVRAGIVASLNRPGANVTGVNVIFTALVPKQVELLHQLVPQAKTIGALVNPHYPDVEVQRQELNEASTVIKREIHIVSASAERDLDEAFRTLVQQKTGALLVANDPFFQSLRHHIVALAARHAIPTIYFERAFAMEGGLISYGPSLVEAFHRTGVYTSRILDGAKPGDLPIEQPTTFELVINLKTAKALSLTIPPSLLARADQVIE
jgi:putative tryptophan/tyrosine transport system substrate-binding protein